ncbi:NADH dehydrogenase [ubiquinone] 1 alpha subcomplex subunit 9, mitochondrial-like, partial [Diadema antillarum]|uniref:NADH dehydrogenase [ubiquinone] 1 alpha subcomplex subunit 9, mitochondrial-like n=1 Tax=Diadema antillarum TaxID=105358 RepID=UPI003A8C312C
MAHKENHLQMIVNRFSEASKTFGLTISLGKTEVRLQPAPNRAPCQPSITVNGTQLNDVKNFKYLGSTLSSDGREGSQIVLPHRCDPYWVMPIKLMGDLGQVMFRQYELRDHDLIRDIVSHCNVVINLLGKDFETRHYTFEDVNIEGPRNLARICKEAGVPRLIHVSALGADLASPSKFLRTKAAGEKVVREQFPEAIIIRPAQMFGREDRFFNHFANQRFFGGVPLYPSARKVVKRPVY